MEIIKKLLKLVGFLTIFSLFICLAHGSEIANQPSQADCFSTYWPHDKSELVQDPSLYFGRLNNGFRYVLMENHEPKDRVAIYLNVQAGSLHEKEHERGYAHFLEHMLFNGSTNFKPGELIEYFQSIGMNFGGDTNAHTTFDETVYKILLPKGGLADIEKGFTVMMDYSRGALLLETEVERERGVILSEKLARDSVSYRTRKASRENALKGTLFSEREPIGINKTLEIADSNSLRSFYNHWYRPEKMILVVVGDFDQKELEPLLKGTFSKLEGEGGFPTCPDFGKLERKGIDAFYHFEPDDGSVSVSIESHWNKKRENDSFELQLGQLKEYFATRILQKRLKLLEEQSGAFFARSQVYSGTLLDDFNYTGLSVSTNGQNWQKSLAVLEQNLRKFLLFGVTTDEVELVKKEIASYLDSSVLTAQTRKSSQLASQIIKSLNDNRVFQSPEQDRDLYYADVMKFTSTEINLAMQNLWSHNNRLIEVTGNVVINNDDAKEIIKNQYQKSKSVIVAIPDVKTELVFPYLNVNDIGHEPVIKKFLKDIDAEILQYDNGVTLNLKQTEYSKNELDILINFGLGKQSEPVPGLAMIAESVVGSSGVGKLTESEMERVLAGSSVEYDFNIHNLSFSIQASSTSNETELLIQTLQTLFVDPAIRQEVFQNKMTRYKQMYLRLKNDIEGANSLYVDRFFAGGNVLFGMPSWDDFSRLELSQIQDWLLPSFKNSSLEISVVGDFDKNEVIKLINKYFGALPKRQKTVLTHLPIKFPKGESFDIGVKSKINKAQLTVAWQTNDYSNISRTRRLHMLASIFEEKIRLAIREKLGASYSPAVYNSSSRFIPGYGVLVSRMIVEPPKIDKVKETVLQICNDLIKYGVKEEELRRAKEPMLTFLKDRVRSNRYWLNSVLSLSSIYPEQLQWPTTILADNASITTPEMTEYARNYLKKEGAAFAIVKPVE